MKFTRVIFGSLFKTAKFAFINRLKIRRYILNYRSGDRFIFNDLFRILLEQNSSQLLHSSLNKKQWLLSWSANFWVFKILIHFKREETIEVKEIFEFLISKNLKISTYYFDLNLFRDAYSCILPTHTLKNLANIFQIDTSAHLRKFIIGHASCVTYSEQFIPELIRFQAEINQTEPFSSDLFPLEITDIDEICETTTTIKSSYVLDFRDPICYGDDTEPVARAVPVPAASVWTIKNCQLIGASQIIKDKKFIVYEKSGNPKIGFVAGIWNFVVFIRNSNRVLINRNFTKTSQHKSGILIAGRCSQNYFHWLIEYVPKILNILKIERLDAPLIVDNTMPAQSYTILDYICQKYSLSYIRANPEELLNFEELIVPSQHTFQPDDPSFSFWEGSALSLEHLNFVSQMGLEMVSAHTNIRTQDKIYLTRKNFTARKIVNEAEIELLFRKHGFHIIDPTSLSFIEQVQLFANAKIIASPTGAALSNIVFCKENTSVISLVAKENKGFCIQANMGKLKKLNFMHVTGDLVQRREVFNSYQEYRFSEFKMDIQQLENAILQVKSQI